MGFGWCVAEGGKDRAGDPTGRWLYAKDVGERGGRVVLVDGSRDLVTAADAGADEDPGDFDFRHRVAAVLFAFAAVVGRDEQDGRLGEGRFGERAAHLADEGIGMFDGFDVLGRSPTRLVAGMVDVVEMHECEGGFAIADEADCALHGVVGAVGILNRLARLAFDQAAVAIPIVEDTADGIWPLGVEHAVDGGEDAFGAFVDGRDFKAIALPIVGSDAMLFGAGTHDHRGPVGAAGSGHDGAGVKGARAFLDEFGELGRVGSADARGAEAVDADENDVFDVRDLGRRSGAGDEREQGE